jgi:4'-phosphopantetheinyl transferase
LNSGETHVWKIPLDLDDATIAGLRHGLSPDEITRADRFVFEKHRRRYIAAHHALRRILSGYLGTAPLKIAFLTGEYGKPFLPAFGESPQIRFNLSHSEELALLGVTLDREIGVDVEWIRPMNDMDRLARTQFAPEEWEEFQLIPEARRAEAFFSGWTRKEACIKAWGKGLSQNLKNFVVNFDPDQPAKIVSRREELSAIGEWSICALTPAPGYCGAVVVAGESSVIHRWCWG